jgi:hypothetical protein
MDELPSRRSAAVNGRLAGPQGRKRASRAAIDGENGVIPCANLASPPSSLTLPGSQSLAEGEI